MRTELAQGDLQDPPVTLAETVPTASPVKTERGVCQETRPKWSSPLTATAGFALEALGDPWVGQELLALLVAREPEEGMVDPVTLAKTACPDLLEAGVTAERTEIPEPKDRPEGKGQEVPRDLLDLTAITATGDQRDPMVSLEETVRSDSPASLDLKDLLVPLALMGTRPKTVSLVPKDHQERTRSTVPAPEDRIKRRWASDSSVDRKSIELEPKTGISLIMAYLIGFLNKQN